MINTPFFKSSIALANSFYATNNLEKVLCRVPLYYNFSLNEVRGWVKGEGVGVGVGLEFTPL